MKENLHTLAYAVTLGVVCAALLTGAGLFTAPYREANEEAEEVRNILNVLQVPVAEDASPQDLLELYEENVRMEQRAEMELYVYAPEGGAGGVRAVAVPFAGQGLWGPIEGFLALEPDMRTIRGVTFHKQEETPGLGGEIASKSFRGQFQGKRVVGPAGVPGIRIRKDGGAEAHNEVDGITGATMTCERVEQMLNAAIERISGREQAIRVE